MTELLSESKKAGELWAIALSHDGQYLASTTFDGRINVWDTTLALSKIREYETKGSFGMCIDLVCQLSAFASSILKALWSVDGRFTATGHENGNIYIFNNESGRLLHSLPGVCCCGKRRMAKS